VARGAGLRLFIDEELAGALVRDSEGADALPLLAFTLKQLLADYRLGSEARLTLQQYEESGGAGGALAQRLRAAQKAAGFDGRGDALKRLFIPMLTTWDDEATPPGAKRLVAPEADLFAGERSGLRHLADALVEERLLTRSRGEGGATLEVAHEALLRQAPLSKWLEESEDFLVWRKRLSRAHKAFEANERGLLAGRELQIARSWAEVVPDDEIGAEDRAFIAESEAEDGRKRETDAERERQRQAAELEAANARAEIAEREQQRQAAELEASRARERAAKEVAEAARAREQAVLETAEAARLSEQAAKAIAEVSRRITRRTLAGLAAAVGLALVAFAIGIYALSQQKQAVAGRNEALAARNEALDARNDANKTAQEEAITSSLYRAEQSIKALQHGDAVMATLIAVDGLPDTQAEEPFQRTKPYVPEIEEAVYGALGARRERAVLVGHTDSVELAEFSPDGRRIVTASADNTARLWDTEGTKPFAILVGHLDSLVDAHFSPDGRRIVTASADQTARVWDAESGKPLATLAGHTGALTSATFSPDSRHVVTSSFDKTARLWDVKSGRLLAVMVGHSGMLSSAAFSPDGRRVVTASWDGTAKLWEAESGNLLRTLAGPTESLMGAAFSPDGRRVVTSSFDHTARVWDAESGKSLISLEGHKTLVSAAAFSPDGRWVVTVAAFDAAARLWNSETGKPFLTLAAIRARWKAPYSVLMAGRF
jgi:WD domain, G-beta repeat